jgi:hypothetical protein
LRLSWLGHQSALDRVFAMTSGRAPPAKGHLLALCEMADMEVLSLLPIGTTTQLEAQSTIRPDLPLP